MKKNSVVELAAKLDKAQAVLDELRACCGYDSFGQTKFAAENRIESAVEAAERAYRDRRNRSKQFDEKLFSEPAWDILLDLFIHQSRNEEVTIKSACIGSNAPDTTALRWLKVLEEHGLLKSSADRNDQRCRLVALTPEGFESMSRYLEQIAR